MQKACESEVYRVSWNRRPNKVQIGIHHDK